MKGLWQGLKHLWEAWKVLAHKIGNFQARVLLTVLYGTAVLPFGLLTRALGDPLRIRKRPNQWLDRPDEAQDLKWAHRQ